MFLQGHRKLKLPPCGEFQSRMNLVMFPTLFVLLFNYHFAIHTKYTNFKKDEAREPEEAN